jgi:hypothetical protein
MKTKIILVVLMAACVALDAHTATREFYNGNTSDMWNAIGAGVLCAICFASYLNDIVKMTKDVHNKES